MELDLLWVFVASEVGNAFRPLNIHVYLSLHPPMPLQYLSPQPWGSLDTEAGRAVYQSLVMIGFSKGHTKMQNNSGDIWTSTLT